MGFEDNVIYIVVTAMIAGFGTLSAFFFNAKKAKQEAKEQAREEMTEFVEIAASKIIHSVDRKVDAATNAIEIMKVSMSNLIHTQENSIKRIEERFDERNRWMREGIERLERSVSTLQQIEKDRIRNGNR